MSETKIKKRFFYEGVELARFCALCEQIDGCEEINEFYGMLAQNAYTWFCEERYPQIIEEYTTDVDPHKKFGRRMYEYVMLSGICEEDDRSVCVRCEVTFKAGKEETLLTFCDMQRWDKALLIMTKRKGKERNKK